MAWRVHELRGGNMGRCSEDGKRKFIYLIMILLIIGSIITFLYDYIVDALKRLTEMPINNIVSMAMAITAMSIAISRSNTFKRLKYDLENYIKDVKEFIGCWTEMKGEETEAIRNQLIYRRVVDDNIRYERRG